MYDLTNKNIPLLLESELECLLGLDRFAVSTLFEDVLEELESLFCLPFLAASCGEVDFSLDALKQNYFEKTSTHI